MSILYRLDCITISRHKNKLKDHTYYFFDDIINVKNFDPNDIKIDEKWCNNIFVYYIGYVRIKYCKFLTINSVNLFTLFSAKLMNTLKKLIKMSIQR